MFPIHFSWNAHHVFARRTLLDESVEMFKRVAPTGSTSCSKTFIASPYSTNQASSAFFRTNISSLRRKKLTSSDIMPLLIQPVALLEVRFADEVGFGLGPTNEFYTLVSKELLRHDMSLWYGTAAPVSPTSSTPNVPAVDDGNDEGMPEDDKFLLSPPASCGFFPRPFTVMSMCTKRRYEIMRLHSQFFFIGQLLARALLDQRKLDLPLSPLLYRLMFHWSDKVHSVAWHRQPTALAEDNVKAPKISPADLKLVDPHLARQLQSLWDMEKNSPGLLNLYDIAVRVKN